MDAFSVVVVVFIGLAVLSLITRLGRGIARTRHMSGEGYWPADRAEIGQDGGEPHGHHHGGHATHHNTSHHDTAHHNTSHHDTTHHNFGGGGDIGGGGHAGGGHHG